MTLVLVLLADPVIGPTFGPPSPPPDGARADASSSSSLSSSASASAPAVARLRVAVVRVDFEGNVAEAARELFAGRVVEGLAAAQFEVFPGATVSQKLAAAPGRLSICRDGGCYPAVAEALGVAYLVA